MQKKIVLAAVLLLLLLVVILCCRSCGSDDGGTAAGGGKGGASDAADTQPNGASTPGTRAASHRLDVPYLSQVGLYPSGCESVSAVMALNYAGCDIDVDSFINVYLPQSGEPYYDEDGLLYGDSPYETFIGSPYSDTSYGCYAPVIRSAMEQALSDRDASFEDDPYGAQASVIDLTGAALSELCENYIDRGIPVIVWGTIDMQPVIGETEWILPDGSLFRWQSPEHCLLLVGYDENCYYFNDPMEDKDTAYQKAAAEQAYQSLFSQALAVVKK